MQAALDSQWTLTKASGTETFKTYDADGNVMTKAPAPTAVDNVNANRNFEINVKKMLIDGKLVIIKDGKQFNAAGAQVQ